MSAKLSVDQVLIKAKSYLKKNDIAEAQKLYQAVLLAFPQNVRAQQGLAALSIYREDNQMQLSLSDKIKHVINLYNQGQLGTVVEQTQSLTKQYPNIFIIWNILGAANKGLGQIEEALEAFKKVIELKPNYADGFNNLGITLQILGKYEEAIKSYNNALSLKPNYPEAYSNLANVFKNQGKLNKAIDAYKKSILLKPDYAEAFYNMGTALKEHSKLDEAIEAYKKALSIKPDYAEAYSNMASVLIDQSKLDEAIEAYKKVLLIKPNNAQAYNNMGVVLHKQSKLDQALEAYNKALLIKPDYPEAHNYKGDILKDQGKLEEAIEAYNKSISLKPSYSQAYLNIGNVFKNQGKLDEAIEAYKKALSIKPDYAEAYNNMGNALRYQSKLDEALEAYGKALLIKPDYSDAYNNMGFTLKDQGKLNEAIKSCNKALYFNPANADAHRNLSFALLNNGELKEGLDEYEWRLKTKDFLPQLRHFLQPLWDGKESLKDKRILIWSEQGIGDTINWSTCLSLITSQAEHCILECQGKLVPLLERSFPNVEVKHTNRSFDLEREDFDFHLPMGSLYKHLIKDISPNYNIKPHLIPNSDRVNFWKKRLQSLGNGPYIGISWKSSNMSPDRFPDNTSLSEWNAILNIPDLTFVNLQYKDYADDLIKIKNEHGVKIHNFEDIDHYNDIDDVAALCSALDIVVSNKITVPFISGGVGTSTKLANWRQSSSNNILLNPMSSSVKIYERNTWEPWDNVFNSIAEDILKFKNKGEANE